MTAVRNRRTHRYGRESSMGRNLPHSTASSARSQRAPGRRRSCCLHSTTDPPGAAAALAASAAPPSAPGCSDRSDPGRGTRRIQPRWGSRDRQGPRRGRDPFPSPALGWGAHADAGPEEPAVPRLRRRWQNPPRSPAPPPACRSRTRFPPLWPRYRPRVPPHPSLP